MNGYIGARGSTSNLIRMNGQKTLDSQTLNDLK
ncbi:Uncharacterised protein [Legionella spiritensis]|nr:Uncharacterised protein [Legionella spiritensis]